METHAVPKRKPGWLRKKLPEAGKVRDMDRLLRREHLHTVCESAHCPNRWECFQEGQATFLILGDRCTRGCAFCGIPKGSPAAPEADLPERVASAVETLGLEFLVITSVTRDDLPDGGARHFAETIRAIREKTPETKVEVLIPDFQGSLRALKTVIDAHPDILNHNIETVPRLYPSVRPGAVFGRSLQLLMRVKDLDPSIPTKYGLMLGLGETSEEIHQTLLDLLHVGCSILTLGQYLQPSKNHLPVERFIPPEEFDRWRESALHLGFAEVASGPFVRSSYHAKELFQGLH